MSEMDSENRVQAKWQKLALTNKLRSSTMRQREPKPTHRLWAGFGTVDAFHDNVASIHTSRQPLGSLIGTNRAFMGRSRGQAQEVADWMWSAEAEPLRSSTVTAPPADDCCWYGRRADIDLRARWPRESVHPAGAASVVAAASAHTSASIVAAASAHTSARTSAHVSWAEPAVRFASQVAPDLHAAPGAQEQKSHPEPQEPACPSQVKSIEANPEQAHSTAKLQQPATV